MNAAKASLVALAVWLAACSTGKSRLPAVPKPADAQSVSPALAHNTESQLIGEVWLRPGLAPRDRSLITVSSLVANGQVGQIGYHLNRAMDNGLTQPEASEMITQLAFYAGWPNAFSAVPVFKEVFNARNKS